MSLGQSLIKLGTQGKVRGETRYGFDMPQAGDLHLACVRAPKAPAKVLGIDPAPAMAVPGVVRVFTAEDVPGEHRLGIIAVTQDQEFIAPRLGASALPMRCLGSGRDPGCGSGRSPCGQGALRRTTRRLLL